MMNLFRDAFFFSGLQKIGGLVDLALDVVGRHRLHIRGEIVEPAERSCDNVWRDASFETDGEPDAVPGELHEVDPFQQLVADFLDLAV
jgi:hypothetical protein